MKNKRGFTIIELVIVLAVGSILFAIIAGLSVLTQGLVISQRANTKSSAEYVDAKTNIEKFITTYSNSNYGVLIASENEVDIYVAGDLEKTPVAKIIFVSETRNLEFYNTSEAELVKYESINLSTLIGLTFKKNNSSELLKCSFDFEDYNDNSFLINLGGMESVD